MDQARQGRSLRGRGSNAGSTAAGAPSLKLAKVVAFSGNIIERTAERNVPWPEGNTLLAPGELGKLLDGQLRHLTRA